MDARKHQAMMDTGIECGTSSFKILWTCGEIGTRNGNDVLLGDMSGR